MFLLFCTLLFLYICLRILFIILGHKGKTTEKKENLAKKYFTQEEIQKGINYHRSGFFVSNLSMIINFLFPFVFLVSGFSFYLSKEFLDITGERFWVQVLLYVLVYSFIGLVINLPFKYYFEYVIEHRFGFSNMNKKDWVIYNLKSIVVGLIISLIIVSVIYAILRRIAFHWVWLVPLSVLVFEIFMMLVWPYVILPLFYKKSDFEHNEYTKPLVDLAEKSGLKIKKIYQINASRYSKHTNAFFTGLGSEKSIYLFDTLIKKNTPGQIASILAHEIGHWKYKHIVKEIAIGFVASIILCIILYFMYPAVSSVMFFKTGRISDISGLPLIMVIFSVLSFFFSPVQGLVSRKFEKQADMFELTMTGEKEFYIKSMVQLARDNKAFLYPHPVTTFWSASHPPILERIEMAENI